MYLIYDFVLLFYAFFYLPYLLLTGRGYADFGGRFGIFSPQMIKQIKAKANIWVHAVSVGEVMLLEGFIEQLSRKYPAYQLIATITTKTGYTLACERLKGKALVIPSPIDFSFVVGPFVSLINPKAYIAVETEIWPNLFRKLYNQKVPLAIINGRISDASFGRYKAIRFLLKKVLNQVSVWCMQSQKDAQKIMDLGAPFSNVVMTGNIKFDGYSHSSGFPSADFVSKKDEFWWVAGSTHPGEEEIVLDVYGKIIKNDPKWRLMIAPRHIERVPQIMDLIARRGFKAVKFSELKDVEKAIIVVDTIGHLRSLYSLASLVFVGNSFRNDGGGHNIIEPASYGKAIIIGPRFKNFRDVVACFMERNAIVQAADPYYFETAVRELCADGEKREALGRAAKEVIAANQGATKRSLERLAEIIK